MYDFRVFLALGGRFMEFWEFEPLLERTPPGARDAQERIGISRIHGNSIDALCPDLYPPETLSTYLPGGTSNTT